MKKSSMKIAFESTAARPIFGMRRTSIFLRSSFVKKIVMPSVGFAQSSNAVVRVSSRMLSATCAVDVQILLPLTR